MKRNEVEKLPLDLLWGLFKQVKTKLSAKLEAETRMLEKRLAILQGRLTAAEAEKTRRFYPKVYPKFRNPARPGQTWSGRGKQPIWIREAIAAGQSIDDFLISKPMIHGAAKGPTVRR
jgi:DNA-binding protein H-NS